MNDYTRIPYWVCPSAYNWTTNVKEYTVRWDSRSHKQKHGVQYDYSCTCRAYIFGNGKYCKHIIDVIKSQIHCNWHEAISSREPKLENGKYYCPQCGLECESEMWAV